MGDEAARGRGMTQPRRAQVAASLGVALFWVGTVVAGALAPGYSGRDDVVSSLAGRGSSVAALGIASILASALAHVAASRVLVARSGPAAGLVLAAGGATAVIAVLRVSCGDGAADCGEGRGEGDALDAVHHLGVVSYELLIVAAMAAVALRAARGGAGWLAVVSAAAGVASVVLLLPTTPTPASGSGSGWAPTWAGCCWRPGRFPAPSHPEPESSHGATPTTRTPGATQRHGPHGPGPPQRMRTGFGPGP